MLWIIPLLLLSPLARANTPLLQCHGDSPHFPNSYFELFLNTEGKLASAYTMGQTPLYYPTWTKAGTVTTPPKQLGKWLVEANSFRDSGIDPAQVKRFQNYFIDGSNRYSVEAWKLIDGAGETLGWVVRAHNEMIGCYSALR